MANMAAHKMFMAPAPMKYQHVGGVATKQYGKNSSNLYVGPSWFLEKVDNKNYGAIVKH